MRIAIIGAGAAGLTALRHSLDHGHSCDVFEKTGSIGGTWNYTDKTGKDEFGLPIHSSMYEGLSTNLPKELMQFEDFPHKKPEHSYISQTEVLNYINEYAEAFNLLQFIKFYHHVEKVIPSNDKRWNLELTDLKTRENIKNEYDAVFVCVGNYSVPSVPKLEGITSFQGSVIHSHDYRNPKSYKNKTVLIIGSGPSGIDIAKLVSSVADKTILSHRSELHPSWKISEEIAIKPEVRQFKPRSVIFHDASEEEIDDVIFCTGYKYSYPFLSPECGIEVENNWVKYLYKHVINIEHPTMAFIGVPFRIFPFPIFGIQVRFFLSYLDGNISITKEEMMEEVMEYMKRKQQLGIPLHQTHLLGLFQGEYMEDIADTAKIKRVPPVYVKMYKHVHSSGRRKGDIYKIISDDDFIQITV
nr:senecionine N-oxygenase-like [Leptinotarsa decemlineata]